MWSIVFDEPQKNEIYFLKQWFLNFLKFHSRKQKDSSKNWKNLDTRKNAERILKIEQWGFSILKYVQKMQMEWQTV